MQQLNKSFIRPFIICTLLALGFLLTSCGDSGSNSATETSTSTTTTTSDPTTNTGSLEHYMCPNGHVGFGSSGAGNCSKCDVALVHNPDFHKNNPAAAPDLPTTPQVNAISPVLTTPSAPGTVVNPNPNQPSTITAPPKNEPPQNAKGVWHYTCPSGCAGGGGSAIACSSCGTTLAHNKEYHN